MDYSLVKSKNPCKTPILFLHGWGGNKNSFAFLRHAFLDRDLYFISFAGHGNTLPPQRSMTVSDFAQDVLDFVKKHNIKKLNIVAHSFGARVALVLCSKNPEMFEKVVLTGAAGLRPKRKIGYYKKVLKFKVKKWLVRLHLMDKTRLNGCGSSDYNALSGVMRETFKNVVNQNLKGHAKKVANETLLIWGEKDIETPLEMGQKLHRFIKNSELVVLSGCSHFCFLEEPARFALILQYFFV